jgi:hypothetical protein
MRDLFRHEAVSMDVRFIWGATAIAAEIGQPEATVYRWLEGGQLPGAKKVGGRWCFRPDVFARSMEAAA